MPLITHLFHKIIIINSYDLTCLFIFPQESNPENDDIVQIETVPVDEDDSYVTPNKPNKAYIAETFDSPQVLGKKWIQSKAKKPDVEEDIAQYIGNYTAIVFFNWTEIVDLKRKKKL